MKLDHGSKIEKEKKLFFSFWHFCLFIYSFLFINDFLIVYNNCAYRILPSIAYETVKNQRIEIQKT